MPRPFMIFNAAQKTCMGKIDVTLVTKPPSKNRTPGQPQDDKNALGIDHTYPVTSGTHCIENVVQNNYI